MGAQGNAAETGFDFVVIGGGSAGCVVASRLSEDSGARVLLLESGGPADRAEIAAPGAWVTLLGGPLDWGYRTVPQTAAADREIPWPRGRVLGGSSSINALVYLRGMRADFDAWAAAGAAGWDYAAVLPAFRALEDFPGGDPRFRGTGGPLAVRLPENPNPLSEAALEAALGLGEPWCEDLNGARTEGVGWNQLTIAGGVRQSAAVAFLEPALSRPNLSVRTGAQVTRLLLEPGDPPRVASVEYVRDGELARVEVRAEAVLCAGTLESPKLLMLSGIGPAAHLRAHGLGVQVDLPGVGENLHDHPGVGVTFEASRQIPPASNQYSELGLFRRSTAELADPDLQWGVLHVPVVAEGDAAPENAFTLYPSLLRPASRGTLRLRSASALDPPLADPAYLSEAEDVRALLRAIELSRELAAAPGLRGWVGREVVPGPAAGDLREYLSRAVNTWFHPVGSCRMGTGEGAVVDPQLRVRGVEGLRVADASVMPSITSANTNAPTLMIGWRAAELIRGTAAATGRDGDAAQI